IAMGNWKPMKSDADVGRMILIVTIATKMARSPKRNSRCAMPCAGRKKVTRVAIVEAVTRTGADAIAADAAGAGTTGEAAIRADGAKVTEKGAIAVTAAKVRAREKSSESPSGSRIAFRRSTKGAMTHPAGLKNSTKTKMAKFRWPNTARHGMTRSS